MQSWCMGLRSIPLKRQLVLQNSYSGLVPRLSWWKTPLQPVEVLEAPAHIIPFQKCCWGKPFRFWSPERKAIVQNTSFYICSVNLSSISTLLGQNCSQLRKEFWKANREFIWHTQVWLFANTCYILQCLSSQECWTLTASLQEGCFWSEMLSQPASATVIHAPWQHYCTKYCNGCLVTRKRYLEEQIKAKEMNGKHQCLCQVRGKKGGFYMQDKCILLLLLIKTWLVSKSAVISVLTYCHKLLRICNNSFCPENLKEKSFTWTIAVCN